MDLNDLDPPYKQGSKVAKALKRKREKRAKQTNKQVNLYNSKANVAIFVSSQRSLEKITEKPSSVLMSL